MRRAQISFALLLCTCTLPALAAEQNVTGLIEPSLVSADATRSWRDGGLGKLRTGSDDGGTAHYGNLRVALDYAAQFTDTLDAKVALDGYAGYDQSGGVTEAWFGYAPVPQSAYQYRLRTGLFLPPLSMENTAAGWTTPYTLTPSLLNDWIGEELRAAGVEATVKRLGAISGSPNTFTLRLGVFEYNDTAGTILAWRGWAANDRVTPWNHNLPLPWTAAFGPGGPFAGAARSTDPFIEVDHRPGYYLTGEWRYLDRIEVQLAHYDNRADPTAFAHHQIGWRTRFDQAALRWHPLANTDVIAQYLSGDTLAGHEDLPRSIYADFTSWFVLASRQWRAHRVSLRYERFLVSDRDSTPLDDNDESGHAWTAAYQYGFGHGLYAGIEYLVVSSDRPERVIDGMMLHADERQWRVALRYFF